MRSELGGEKGRPQGSLSDAPAAAAGAPICVRAEHYPDPVPVGPLTADFRLHDATDGQPCIDAPDPVSAPALRFYERSDITGKLRVVRAQGRHAPYYQDEAVTIYHGDALALAGKHGVDMVITDPPYNAGKNYGKTTNDRRSWPEWAEWLDGHMETWDAPEVLMFLSQTAYRQYVKHGRREIAWSAIWIKPLSMAVCAAPFMPHWEHIVYFGDRKKGQQRHADGTFIKHADGGFGGDVLTANIEVGQTRWGHPTPKPIKLLRELIARTDAQTILDPFMGSGTTLRAAKDLGRKAIGIEINEEFCAMAVKRMAQGVLLTDEQRQGLVSR